MEPVRTNRQLPRPGGQSALLEPSALSLSPSRLLTFQYDMQGRRIGKKVERWTGSAWVNCA